MSLRAGDAGRLLLQCGETGESFLGAEEAFGECGETLGDMGTGLPPPQGSLPGEDAPVGLGRLFLRGGCTSAWRPENCRVLPWEAGEP